MCASKHQNEKTTSISGVAVRHGKSLRTCYLFLAGTISAVVVASILFAWTTGSDSFNSASITGQILLAVLAPVFIIVSTFIHEMIHAIGAKKLMEGEGVTVKFSRWGASMSATVNEHSTLWRKLVTILAPAVLVSTGSFMLVLVMALLGVFNTEGFIRMVWEAAATSLVVVAMINLFNLIPLGKLDGGIALKEIIRSLRGFRDRRTIGLAAT